MTRSVMAPHSITAASVCPEGRRASPSPQAPRHASKRPEGAREQTRRCGGGDVRADTKARTAGRRRQGVAGREDPTPPRLVTLRRDSIAKTVKIEAIAESKPLFRCWILLFEPRPLLRDPGCNGKETVKRRIQNKIGVCVLVLDTNYWPPYRFLFFAWC